MKRFLKNKKGVSLLEGLIALLLLALVATGTFGVLLSTSRRSTQPDVREEMTLAVERAMNKLQVYVFPVIDDVSLDSLPEDVKNGLCGGDSNPISTTGAHDISCMLPPTCDKNNNSSFNYTLTKIASGDNRLPKQKITLHDIGSVDPSKWIAPYSVSFNLTCNGFRL